MAFSVSKRLKLHLTVENASRNEQTEKQEAPVIGGILSGTYYVWQAKGAYLEIRNTKNAVKVGCWTFGNVLRDSDVKVVFVKELKPISGGLGLLAVALDCAVSGGIICLFNVFCSKVIRAINVKKKITSLHIIDPGVEVLNLPGPLRDFDGIVAVGTDDGDVLLIDLCRRICEHSSPDLIRDELCPSQLLTITPNKIQKIGKYRGKAIDDGDHLAIHLNVVLNSQTEHFTLKGPKEENRAYVNRDEVQTSALHYCPQLTSLLVGYNFGAFQLWDLTSFQLMYTSAVCEDHVPISHFCLLEPTDDPRAFCYIWVSYSNLAMHHRGLPFAVMYSLSYESKEHHEGYGYLYQGFQHCSVRFKVELGALQENKSGHHPEGGLCLGFQPIIKASSCKDTTLQPTKGDVLVLCQISWTIWYPSSEIQSYAIIFDLNQWYKEQMPKFSKWSNTVNYILKINLSNYIAPSNSYCMAAEVNLTSLKQFVAIQKLEEHFYPTSLTLDMVMLTNNEIILIHTNGIQKALLQHIQATGPICLLKPNEVYQKICSLGLTPLFVDANSNPSLSVDFKREVILNTIVEYSLSNWLYRCALEWANGRFSSSGCSLDFLLNWAFQRAVVLKFNCENFCVPLFDYSQFSLDHNTSLLLRSGTVQLNTLYKFFSYVINSHSEYLADYDVAVEQRNSLEMTVTYFEVLQWLINVGLLPECHPTAYHTMENSDKITAPYPVEMLTEYYVGRRAELQSLSQQRFTSSDSLLFIDNLMNNFDAQLLQKQWQEDGGNGLYPPPSLQSLLRTYLIPGTHIYNKHLVVLYLFLDLATILDQSLYSSIINYLIKFPAVFKVTPSLIKITQAFWHLDHGDYHTAIEQLLDPSILKDDLQPWYHKIAMRSLLLQNQHNAALYYMQVKKPPITGSEDVLTAISLYISNNMLAEAFYFMRKHCQEEERFLIHLFNECNKNSSLLLLLYKNLNDDEEKAFLKYLRTLKNPNICELQVFYFLLRSRFVEGFEAHYSNLKGGRPECQGVFSQKNASKANRIINTFKNLLPDVYRDLVEFVRKEKNNVWREVSKSTPLSVFVHNKEEKTRYKSTMIHAAISKAKDTFDQSSTQNFNQTLLGTEDTPFLRTPVAFKSPSRHAIPVITPKVVEFNENKEMEPSPSKRRKLNDGSASSPFNGNVTAYSQMLTPVIKRNKSPCRERSQSNTSNISAPQSILKVRSHEKVTTFNDKDSKVLTEVSPRKSALGLTPRRSLARQHVQFEDSIKDSSTLSEQKSEQMDLTGCNEISVSSCDLSALTSSKSISATSEDFFSVNSSYEIKSDKQNESESVIIVDDQPDESVKEDSSIQFSHAVVGKLFSPKARRSYKRALEEMSPIRSSPRLSRRIPESKSELNEKAPYVDQEESSILSPKSSSIQISEQASVDKTPLKSVLSETDDVIKVPDSESKTTVNVSKYRQIKGRRSLSREVLEHNTFSKLHSEISPSREIISREVSYSETSKTYVILETPSKSESSILGSTTDISISSLCSPQNANVSFTSDSCASESESDKLWTALEKLKKKSEAEDSNSHQNSELAKEEIVEQLEEYSPNEQNKTMDESLLIIEHPVDDDDNTNLNKGDKIQTANEEDDNVIMQVYEDLSYGSEDEILSENTSEDHNEFNISDVGDKSQNPVILEHDLAYVELSPNEENMPMRENTIIEISSEDSSQDDSINSNDSSEDYEHKESPQIENLEELDVDYEHGHSDEQYTSDYEDESDNKSSVSIENQREEENELTKSQSSESDSPLGENIISGLDEFERHERGFCVNEGSDTEEKISIIDELEKEESHSSEKDESREILQPVSDHNLSTYSDNKQTIERGAECNLDVDNAFKNGQEDSSISTNEKQQDIEKNDLVEQVNLNAGSVDKDSERASVDDDTSNPKVKINEPKEIIVLNVDSDEKSTNTINPDQPHESHAISESNNALEKHQAKQTIKPCSVDKYTDTSQFKSEPSEDKDMSLSLTENKSASSTSINVSFIDKIRKFENIQTYPSKLPSKGTNNDEQSMSSSDTTKGTSSKIVVSESNNALEKHQAKETVKPCTVDKCTNTSQFKSKPSEDKDMPLSLTENKSASSTSINVPFIDKIRKSENIQTYPSKLPSKGTNNDEQSTSSSDTTKDTSSKIVVTALVHSPDRPIARRLRRSVSTSQLEISEESLKTTRQSNIRNSKIDGESTDNIGIKKGNKRSRSITPSYKNLDKSEDIDCNLNASQEIIKDKIVLPLTRRMKSKSVDHLKTYAREDSLTEDSASESTFARRKSRPKSVSSLPIMDEEKNTKTKKNVEKMKEDYHASRRLTRSQMKLIANIPKINEVEVEASDSDAENDDDDLFDPINLLDKESFKGEPDLEEQNYYKPKRITRSASNASEISVSSSVSPVKRKAAGKRQKEADSSTHEIQTRSKTHSDVSSVVSESSSPPKKLKGTKDSIDVEDNVSISSRISNRSKSSSVKSGKSPTPKGSKRRTYTRKSTLDKIEEEPSTSKDVTPKKSTRRRKN